MLRTLHLLFVEHLTNKIKWVSRSLSGSQPSAPEWASPLLPVPVAREAQHTPPYRTRRDARGPSGRRPASPSVCSSPGGGPWMYWRVGSSLSQAWSLDMGRNMYTPDLASGSYHRLPLM